MFRIHFNRVLKNSTSRIVILLVLLIHISLGMFDIISSFGVPRNFLYDYPGYLLGLGENNKYRYYFQFNEVYIHLFVMLVAVLPYSISFYEDKENGVVNNIFTRKERIRYFISGLIVNFTISFLIYFIPRIIVVSIEAIAFPLNNLKIGYSNLDFPGATVEFVAIFRDLFLYKPYLYFLIVSILAGLHVALFSSIVYAFSMHIRINKYVVLILPVLILFVIEVAIELLLGYYYVPANIFFSSDSLPPNKINFANYILILYCIEVFLFITLFTTGLIKNRDIY